MKYRIYESYPRYYFYHIGSDRKSLCGYEEGKGHIIMGTEIPIETWGTVSHMNEKYCKKCENLFKTRRGNDRTFPTRIERQSG